ncbi:hypothetical protein ABT215_09515 [Streptomyces sp900105755]|uniref:hypothetical protein n=1 Tax=Streptomyces sp. 900105755 TaxID=3154389 RepID=UPI003329EA6A
MAGGNFHDRADEPATLYVIQNQARQALKIGVAHQDRIVGRLREHDRHGWTTELTLEFKEGVQALQVERAVIAFLRSCGVASHLPQCDMPQGGYTETFAHVGLAKLDLKDVTSLAELAARLVQRSNCPVHAHVLHLAEAADEVFRLAKDGHKEQARKLWALVQPVMEETIRALE